jgi:hypothetical protein
MKPYTELMKQIGIIRLPPKRLLLKIYQNITHRKHLTQQVNILKQVILGNLL